MYQRQICPSMGAIRLPLTREVFKVSNRSFHITSRRAEDAPTKPTQSAPEASRSTPPTRRARSAAAFQHLKKLPGAADQSTDGTTTASTTPTPARFTIRRVDTQGNADTQRPPPPGTLVRAPTNLRFSRSPTGGPSRGPSRFGPRKPSAEGTGKNPLRSSRKPKSGLQTAKKGDEDVSVADSLTDGMVQQLLRLQRKQWDRVPYEPIYSSKEKLDELVALGGSLFKGEEPARLKVKSKEDRRFERVIGIQNMHGV